MVQFCRRNNWGGFGELMSDLVKEGVVEDLQESENMFDISLYDL